jgi:hypothetical protein
MDQISHLPVVPSLPLRGIGQLRKLQESHPISPGYGQPPSQGRNRQVIDHSQRLGIDLETLSRGHPPDPEVLVKSAGKETVPSHRKDQGANLGAVAHKDPLLAPFQSLQHHLTSPGPGQEIASWSKIH